MSFGSAQFELAEERLNSDTRVISVSGEIHVTTAPEFSQRLNDAIAAGTRGVVIDMSGVEFIDSTGLSVLLNGLRRVTRADGQMALVVSNPTVLRLFEITKLDSTFDIQPTREAAIGRIQLDGAASSDGAP
ncbi:MAG: STAS domain-containing protein [Solirubrobacteraceae bacterium]